MLRLFSVLLTTAGFVLGVFASPASALTEQEELIEKARFTISKLSHHPDHPTLPDALKQARAVLVVPRLIKAGFIVGGEGGSGVLLARGANGQWSYPAFYTMGAGSIGLQVGAQTAEVLFVIMNDQGLKSIIDDQFTFGADLSAAIGSSGKGREAATTTNLDADVFAYALAEGAFIGAAFDGTVFNRRDDWNYYYYGRGANAQTILLEQRFANPHADELREELAQF